MPAKDSQRSLHKPVCKSRGPSVACQTVCFESALDVIRAASCCAVIERKNAVAAARRNKHTTLYHPAQTQTHTNATGQQPDVTKHTPKGLLVLPGAAFVAPRTWRPSKQPPPAATAAHHCSGPHWLPVLHAALHCRAAALLLLHRTLGVQRGGPVQLAAAPLKRAHHALHHLQQPGTRRASERQVEGAAFAATWLGRNLAGLQLAASVVQIHTAALAHPSLLHFCTMPHYNARPQ